MNEDRMAIAEKVVSFAEAVDIMRSLEKLGLDFVLERRHAGEPAQCENNEITRAFDAKCVLRVYRPTKQPHVKVESDN